jgi:SAM-dependent methyltransferase
MSPLSATYVTIGRAYSRYRRADPRIAAPLHDALGTAGRVVDVGAGTGSYEPLDRSVVAVEPSAVMIGQRPTTTVPMVMAPAEALPFEDASFDAAMAVLTLHHWPDPASGLAEMRRVARRQVVLTFDPEVHNRFWLITDYFPAAAELEASRSMALGATTDLMGATTVEVVPVPHDCRDGFGWAYWRRPETYLNPDACACISMLAQLEPDQLDEGRARLASDLVSGAWTRRHGDLLDLENIDGGYRILVAE